MSSTRRAVIDVGTNSVKLLVADVNGADVRPVWEGSRQTRLGEGFYESHRLQAEPIAYSANAVADFARSARERGAAEIRVIATSAARDAANADDLASAIESAAKLKLEIISGEQEAAWAFQGVATDPQLARQPLLLLDVGGGSTEFILGQGEQRHFSASFPLGTVRLMETLPHSDPPLPSQLAQCRARIRDFLAQEVRPELEPALRRQSAAEPVTLVGTGGSTTILARMEARLEDFDRGRIEAVRLSSEALRATVDRLWRLPLAERQKIIGLPPNRADVILTGAAICEGVMESFGFRELRVSTRGLRFAAVMDR